VSLFRLDASIRREGSTSRAIADIVESSWREGRPDAPVTRRSIGLEPLASTAWALSVSADRAEPANQTSEQRDAVALAGALVDELLDAEAFLFAVPLYNFGISQHFKTWVDLVITDPRMAAAGGRPLAGRPAVVVVVRGGAYGPGTPREGWDHASGWIRRILEDVWGLDLHVVETEFTLVGVNPALDQFAEVAAQMRRDAEELAARHGRHLSEAFAHDLAGSG
jgi:FMN-dependent NADH-azoreductase